MGVSRSSSNLIAIVLVCGIGGGCSVFTSLGSLEPARGDASAVVDASSEDAPNPDTPDGAKDAQVNADASVDAANDALPDATDDAGACKGPLLVGSSDISAASSDMVAMGSTDAYGYLAVTTGTARCAWVHLLSAGTGLQLGVYSHSSPGGPSQLQATATIAVPKVGWNVAILDMTISITQATKLWLALLVTGTAPTIRVSSSCLDSTLTRVSRTGFTMPQTFNGTSTGTDCSAPFYLTP
jgi:hypothetical protein